jgi:hypothetical protein
VRAGSSSAPGTKVNEMKRAKSPPIWLRRLSVVKTEMKTVRFPGSAEEGFLLCARLSDAARRCFLESLRKRFPRASAEEIEMQRRRWLARRTAAETRRLAQWKKDLDRFFRG